MRFLVVLFLAGNLVACGISPKDYSDASKLKPIDVRVMVEPLWIKSTGDVPEYAHAQLLPAVVGQNVFIASVNGDISLMNADDGKQIWSRKLDVSLTSGPGIGAGMIFVGTQNAEIIALDQQDGTERWRVSITSETLARPLITNGSLIIQTIDGKLTSLDVKTGKLVWSYNHNIPKLTLRGTASPIIAEKQIITGFADGKLVSLDVNTGEVNWEVSVATPRGRTDLERLSDIDGLFQAANGTIYVSSYQGRVAAISALDGSILWARKMSSFNGLTVDASQIYISDATGQVWALDSRTGATLWRQNNLNGRDISTPVVMNNAVVIADYAGYIHWLSVDDGQFIARQNLIEIWDDIYQPVYDSITEEMENRDAHRLVSVPPLVINDVLYVRDNTGMLAALRVESALQ